MTRSMAERYYRECIDRFKVLNNIEGDAKTEEEYEALKAKHSGERGAIHARIETLKPYLK